VTQIAAHNADLVREHSQRTGRAAPCADGRAATVLPLIYADKVVPAGIHTTGRAGVSLAAPRCAPGVWSSSRS